MSEDMGEVFGHESFLDSYLRYSYLPGEVGSGNEQRIEPADYYGVLAKDFDCNGTMSITPNSQSSSSAEQPWEEENEGSEKNGKKGQKVHAREADDESPPMDKNASKAKKKGQKRERETRFAFITESQVEQLEDGYRWRKYGQKAVKNSPYPRSYYRCTAQKCSVKKRVERSYQDPSVVITTYEGQHTHHCPANARGSSQVLAHPYSAMGGFHSDLLGCQHPFLGQINPTSSGYGGFLQTQMHSQQQLQVPNYGSLLHDIMPSFIDSSKP